MINATFMGKVALGCVCSIGRANGAMESVSVMGHATTFSRIGAETANDCEGDIDDHE